MLYPICGFLAKLASKRTAQSFEKLIAASTYLRIWPVPAKQKRNMIATLIFS
jgi:hypothetical protein